MVQSPYDTGDLELLEEIHAAAEARLQAQLTAALAADQRALIFAGFAATAAVALAGGGAAVLVAAEPQAYLGIVAILATAGMIVAMALAVQAARPIAWFYPGGQPSNWKSDIAAAKPKRVRLSELAADYDHRIVANETSMSANGRLLRISNLVALMTLLISAAAVLARFLLFCTPTA